MLVGLAAHAQAQQNSADVEHEVDSILAAMSDEQKRLYCIGYGVDFSFTNIKGVFNIRPVDDLELEDGTVIDLPLIYGVDGGIGFVGHGFEPGVRFPAGPLLASTWNPDLAESLGDALGREGSARGIHRFLGPGSNFYRTPYNGRSFEYVTGEDPFLGATLLPPLVQAMQEHRVMATVKHPVLNDQEINRETINIVVDERTLREIYLPPFESAVKLADPAALMGSFNKVNGDWACESHFLLTEIYKEDWGFPGFVESDFLAIHDGVKAAKAGIDIDMPGGIGSPFGIPDLTVMTPEDLEQSGADVVNDKVRRMLRRIVSYDFINNPPQESEAAKEAAAENSRKVAIQSAREGIVLLENKKNFLPLNRHSIKKIAVIGPNATGEPPTGSGAAFVPPSDDFISEIDGIKSLAPGAKVDYITECVPDPSTGGATIGDRDCSVSFTTPTEISSTPVRVDELLNFTSFDAINLPADNPAAFPQIWTGTVTPTITGDHVFKVSSVGNVQLYVNDKLIVDDTSDEQTPPLTPDTPVSGAPPLIPISGKISLKAGVSAKIELKAINLGPTFFYSATALQVSWASLQPPADFAKYDAVVLAVGGNERYDGERRDRSFRLPELQDDLIVNATKSNPRTIVVLHGGGGFNVQAWVDKVRALLHAWFPGQYGGQPLAEILFGEVNPSGKLPITMEKRVQDNPAFATFPTDPDAQEIKYSEGLFVGYRGYEKNRIKPQYPFGYGLSYTKFRYSDIEVDPFLLRKNVLRKGDDLVRVSFRVRNTGKLAGAEIAQLYVAPVNPPVERPLQELKGFLKVYLKPGESKKVTINLDRRSLAYYNVTKRTWDVAPGLYWILVGSSSQDIELRRPLVNLFPSSLSVLESTPVPGAKKVAQDLSSTDASARTVTTAAGAPALTVNDGSGSGGYDLGAIVTVTADPPPPGKEFSGWSGDTQILANPSAETTTATMPSIDVTITATYSDASSGEPAQ